MPSGNPDVGTHTVIFDIDDTLVRTCEVAYAKGVLVAHALGLTPPSFDQFKACFGILPFDECVARWHPGTAPGAYSREYESLTDKVPYRPVEGAAAVVCGLRMSGARVAVLTNGPGPKTRRKLAAAGIREDELAFIRHADNAQIAKPDPASFRAVAEDFDLEPANATYVSDHPADGRGATQAGFGFLGVCTGRWRSADFRAAGIPRIRVLPDVSHVHLALGVLGVLSRTRTDGSATGGAQ